ncbi:MAG: M42 family metallopeptidase [Candidatus Krumholzibacteria bacterium]|jgi:endoglucanase|nr:M42 family metallopeptidase [Candidatus Krumholzibacteria bacterium]
MDRVEELMKRFTGAMGVSGAEEEVFGLMKKELEPIAEISRDRLGSFIGRLKGGPRGPRIMLAAHMDEIGLMVSHFTGNFIRFNTLGGWWNPRLIGLPVRIRTSKKDIMGVVASKSPFHMDKEERDRPMKSKDLYIDVGLTGKKKPESLGIRPGDPVVPEAPFTVLEGGGTYMAKAWDDRAGCVALVEIMRRLSKYKLPNAVYCAGTVQEEVGLRGAVTSGHSIAPDLCFAIDVNIAQDLPGSPDGSVESLGAGVSICVYDATLIPNVRLRDHVAAVAERKKIPHHFSAIPFGGTDGGKVHLNEAGVPTLVIGIPTRYIHSQAGILCRKDFDNTVKLMVEVVRTLDGKTVGGFI